MTEDNTNPTPGPWTVWHDEFGSRRHMTRIVVHAEDDEICEVQKCPQAEANARLIAAAPDRAKIADKMLAVLKEVKQWADYDPILPHSVRDPARRRHR